MINELLTELHELQSRAKMSAVQRLESNFKHDYPALVAHNNLEYVDGDLYVICETGADGLCVAPKSESEYPCDEILDGVFAYRIKLNLSFDRTMIREVYTERCDRDTDPAEGYYFSWCVGKFIGGKNGN
jgi:hypothetical protein